MLVTIKEFRLLLQKCTTQLQTGARIIVAKNNSITNSDSVKFYDPITYRKLSDEISFNLQEMIGSMEKILGNIASIAGYTSFDDKTSKILINLGAFQSDIEAASNLELVLKTNEIIIHTGSAVEKRKYKREVLSHLVEGLVAPMCSTKPGKAMAIEVWEKYTPENIDRPAFLDPETIIPERVTFRSEIKREKLLRKSSRKKPGNRKL